MKWVISKEEALKRHLSLKKIPFREEKPLKSMASQKDVATDPGVIIPGDGNDSFAECYKFYKDKQSLDAAMKDKKRYHIWVSHYVEKVYSDAEKRDYEMYCGGWLQFYDLEVIDGDDDHSIYFDWTKANIVIIYISNSKKRKKRSICFDVESPALANDPPPPKGPPPPPAREN